MGRKFTNEEFLKRFNEYFGSEYKPISEYVNVETPVEIKHICGYIFKRKPRDLWASKYCLCPKCYPSKGTTRTIPYVNDIYTTNKKLYNLLLNKDDGHKYKEHSKSKTWFQCPYCGEYIFTIINDVNRRGLSCPRCSHGVSYAEKFMYNLLLQLNLDVTKQYSPEWLKPYYYDFYFVYNNQEFIVETDGGLGHGHKTYDGKDDVIGFASDCIKDNLSKNHNIKVIRIDCNYKSYNRFEYIKTHILNSELNNIFDLINNVDFSLCNEYAETSNFIKLINLWNNGTKCVTDLSDILNINKGTIYRYLKNACSSKLINLSYNEVLEITKQEGIKRSARTRRETHPCGIKVRCIETNEIFDTMEQGGKKYGCRVTSYFQNNQEYCGKLPDGTKLHWEKII